MLKHFRVMLRSLALVAMVTLCAQAQAPEQAGLTLNFRDAPLEAVLDYLSQEAGLVIVQATPVEGRVTLVSRQPLSVDETIGVLNTVLREQDYAAVRTGRTLRIVPIGEAGKHDVPVHSGSDPLAIEAGDQILTQVIPIGHADAQQLRSDLEPLLPSFATLTANERSNSLILTSSASNIRRIVEIVNALDRGIATSAEVRVFTLEYASATDAARLVNDLFGERALSPSEQRDRARQIFMGRGGRGGGGGEEANQPGRAQARVTASADQRTNTVVVSGPPETLTVIEQVLVDLDANPAATQAVMIYPIRNGQAASIATVLNNLLVTTQTVTGGRGGAARRQGDNRGGATSGGRGGAVGGRRGDALDRMLDPVATFAQAERFGDPMNDGALGPWGRDDGTRTDAEGNAFALPDGSDATSLIESAADLDGSVSVVADEDTNTLIILTGTKNFEQLRLILDELDRPVPQVVIKVLIAEVTHDDSRDIGVDWTLINPRNSGETTLFTDVGAATAAAQPGAGLVFRLLESDVQATLRALDREGKVDVLSRPYILTSDNQLATITVGNEVPFIRQSRTTDSGQVINDIQYEDIGIILNVTPHINPDGLVTLNVEPEISALTESSIQISETVRAPVFSKRSASSRVAVRDGQTIVIGGLMEDRKTRVENKVPLLGDIPLLGNLFRNTSDRVTKTELLIFMTPQVVLDPLALDGIGQRELEHTEIIPHAVTPGALDAHLNSMRPDTATE